MTSPVFVTIAVEGPTDSPVARRLLTHIGLDAGPIHEKNGKNGLDKRLTGYNNAAANAPWLVLRDLDHDAPCAGDLVNALLPNPSAQMCFRIAVRKMEAWLLADREQLARYLSVSIASVPSNPEQVEDPKLTIVNLARRSRRRAVREDIVPVRGTTATVGPGYLARITEFATDHWRPDVAALSCSSLKRCLDSLGRWVS